MIAQPLDHQELIVALARHIGKANGIHAADLALKAFGDDSAAAQRRLRSVIEELRRDGHHICGRPESGYFIARTAEELEETCAYLYTRAMTTLTQWAAMKRVSLPDLKGQLRLPT